ncbi:MFS transporter [Streptomyces sp. NPDC005438]|uniref:MFS transporter n=1 Tax=Streptomyces sp. NPDC005438 TaxID=3156880 RepID=UPI0033A5AB95
MRAFGRSYQRLYLAAVGSRFGDSARTSAIAVLAAQLTSSPAVLSWVSAMSFAPWLLFGLPAGALVDRVDKRRAFLWADGARCLLLVVLTTLAFAGQLTIPWLIVCAFALTSAQTMADSCFTGMLPTVVDNDQLGPANARLSASQSTAQVAGPPTGSALAALGAGWPFLLNALTFGASAAWVSSLPTDTGRRPHTDGSDAEPRQAGWRRLRADIAEGVRRVRARPPLPLLLGGVAVSNLCNGLNSAVLPLLATRELGVSMASYGFLIGANAASMVAGNLTAGAGLKRGVADHTLATAAIAVKIPGFALVCLAPSFAALLVGMAVLGLGAGMWNVPSSTLMMRSAPPEVLGRTNALFRTVAVAGMPLGAVLGGAVATLWGLRASAATAGALTVLLLIYFIRRIRAPKVVTGAPAVSWRP